MAPLRALIDHLDELLQPATFEDFGPNGLQVPGAEEVGTLVTGVSAHLELFERAADAGADLVLVHHGIFWDRAPRRLDVPAKRRLQILFDHDMALAAYHLPLDGHLEVGNNALIAAGLGCDSWKPFAGGIGVAGRFPGDGPGSAELVERVRDLTAREPLVFDFGPENVRSIGVLSGAGASQLDAAISAGLDAFLTGEPAERAMAQAREAGIHFLAAGHYATETFGVRRLGDLLAERFGVAHHFIDIPNPV
jgi:dinuclear metal center YbgI/SA1388 family protein